MYSTAKISEAHTNSHTPSKREKYDSYTPRKRYVKEQDEFTQYQGRSYQEHYQPSPKPINS